MSAFPLGLRVVEMTYRAVFSPPRPVRYGRDGHSYNPNLIESDVTVARIIQHMETNQFSRAVVKQETARGLWDPLVVYYREDLFREQGAIFRMELKKLYRVLELEIQNIAVVSHFVTDRTPFLARIVGQQGRELLVQRYIIANPEEGSREIPQGEPVKRSPYEVFPLPSTAPKKLISLAKKIALGVAA